MDLWATQYFLEHSNPNSVFDWLKENQCEQEALWNDERKELEKKLFDRNDPVINLGLSLYGTDADVGHKLFQSPETAIKMAVLSGTSISSAQWILEEIPNLLNRWDTTLLESLLSNKLIEDEVLVSLYDRKSPFNELCDKDWITLCAFTSNNERIATPYNTDWIDGYDEYQYELVFFSGWSLFETFPQTPLACRVLEKLSRKLVKQVSSKMDIEKVIERWNTNDPSKQENFSFIRYVLANLIPSFSKTFKGLEDSSDIALRKAFYKNTTSVKPSDIDRWFDRDGKDFVDAALDNELIFAKNESREALKNICWKVDEEGWHFDYPNYFTGRYQYWFNRFPDRFEDEQYGIPFEELTDKSLVLERRIEQLNKQVSEIHSNLLNTNNDGIYSEDSTRDYELNESYFNTLVSMISLQTKRNRAWSVALGFGLVLGYILARY